VDANWGTPDGEHIGATWPVQLNRTCVATMQAYVKSLSPLVYELVATSTQLHSASKSFKFDA